MMPRLRLRHVENRYRLPAGVDDPDERARYFDRIAVTELPRSIDAMLPDILASTGLSASSEIAIRRLSVRLRMADPFVDPGALSSAWARAFGEAFERGLTIAGRGSAGAESASEAGSEILVFEDRFAAEYSYLVMRARGIADAWWWRLLLSEDERLPRPAELLRRWIEREPTRLPTAFTAVLGAAPEGMGSLFTTSEAHALVEGFLRVWRSRVAELTGETGPDGAQGSDELPAEIMDAGVVSGATRRALAAAPARQVRRLIALLAVTAHAPAYSPRNVETLDAVAERLLKGASTEGAGLEKARSEVLREARPARPARPRAGEDQISGVQVTDTLRPFPPDTAREDPEKILLSRSGEAQPDSGEAPVAPRSLSPPGSDAAPIAPSPDQRRPSAESTLEPPEPAPKTVAGFDEAASASGADLNRSMVHEVACGGLLFLIRPLARLSLVRLHAGAALEARLLAFAQLVLHRLLDPLPEAARCAAFERERPVVSVFAGLAELPEVLRELPDAGKARDDAAAALDELTATIPDGANACPNGLRFTYGFAADPFPHEGPLRGLVNLVVRPGRLRLTRTHADLYLPMRAVDLALRQGGWDIDPAWVPYLGRVIRFHYEGS